MKSAIDPVAATRHFAFAGQDIPWLLQHWVRKTPDRIFLVWEPADGNSRHWTYEQFFTAVRRIAAGLLQRGIQRRQRVLIHCDNCPEAVLCWYACALIGATAVTTNTRCKGEEIAYFISHSRAVAALTQPRYAAEVAANGPNLKWMVVTEDDSGEMPDQNWRAAEYEAFASLQDCGDTVEPRQPEPMLPVGIQFTSGTTARPKAVVHTHANALWGGSTGSDNLHMRGDEVYLVFLPFFHVNSQSWAIWTTLWHGGSVVLMPKFSASRFWPLSLKYRCTRASMIPFCIKAIAAQPVPEHQYRCWVTGIILPELEELFKVRTFAGWGMTETIIHSTRSNWYQDQPRMTIGKPVPGYEFAIINEQTGEFCKTGEIGKLWVRGQRGVQLFLEYADNPQANAKAFDANGWFDTGDTVRVETEGHLFFADRDKDILKVGGENVSAQQVEQVCMMAGGLQEVAVVAKPDPMLDEVPVVFAIASAGEQEEELRERILEHCKNSLADFKVPREIRFVAEFPRATLDKIAKNKLRDQLQSENSE